MTRPTWVPNTVFYQVFPDRFRNGDPRLDPPDVVPWGSPPTHHEFQGGDLLGVIKGLRHLEWLGVSGIYLNPVFAAQTNHRYDTRDYFAVDPHLGDIGILRELVEEAHSLGIRVILDGVFNHCGADHPAFRDWRRLGDKGTHAGWFFGWGGPQPAGEPDYQTCGGAAYLPKLNLDNPEVRDHVLRAATYWIDEAHIDGWRLDVPWKVPLDFWEQFGQTVRSVAPDAYLVGEIWRDAALWLDVFDGTMNYQQRAAIIDYTITDAMDGEDFHLEIAELLRRHGEAAPWMLNLVGCHDTSRILTVAGSDVERVKVALTAMFTLPGAPMLYYGDEIGLEGGDDPGCRGAMPWDTAAWNHDLLATVRSLVAIRRQHPALSSSTFEPLVERNGLCAYARRHESDRAIVVLNPRGPQRDLPITVDTGMWIDVLSGTTYEAKDRTLLLDTVPGRSALLLISQEKAP
ncbi:MAG: alpha-amylase family glycosyl hydrolase [Acidimicrobiia bacterium]|jgi:glycosidase